MSADEVFFDASILLDRLSDDAANADDAESQPTPGGTNGVQVLNELASVVGQPAIADDLA
jgi:hypothetical protein